MHLLVNNILPSPFNNHFMEPVIIVGGGLGGLILAALLEKAGLVYTILERSAVAKMPLEGGGVIVLTTQIQPLLQQLGFLSALEDLSKPVEQITVLDHSQLHGAHAKPVRLGRINFAFARERLGLHRLLLFSVHTGPRMHERIIFFGVLRAY